MAKDNRRPAKENRRSISAQILKDNVMDAEQRVLDGGPTSDSDVRVWRVLITKSLCDIETATGSLIEIVHDLELSIARMETEFKIKSGMWGAVAALASIMITLGVAATIHFIK